MRWGALIGALVPILAILIAIFSHHTNVEYYSKLVDSDPSRAGRELSYVSDRYTQCNAPSSEYIALSTAIFMVERLASGYLKRAVTNLIGSAYVALGIAPPDFSFGPGQIKISTLMRAHSDNIKGILTQDVGRVMDAIVDDCSSLALSASLLRDEMHIGTGTDGLLPRSEVLRAAGLWNGQIATTSAEAAIANARYRELVYQTFINLRFSRALEKGANAGVCAHNDVTCRKVFR